jgi:hypothetical protein
VPPFGYFLRTGIRCLCIRRLEKLLGRKLKPKDFLRNHPFNYDRVPGTPPPVAAAGASITPTRLLLPLGPAERPGYFFSNHGGRESDMDSEDDLQTCSQD